LLFIENGSMIGLEFEWNEEIRKLEKLFESFMISNYEWQIIEDEIVSNNCNLILDKKYSGDDFKKIWENLDLIIFLNVQVYLKESMVKPIKTYSEYKDSDCQLMLLISDIRTIEVYSKDKKILNSILNSKIENIEIKTEEKDNRVIMRVN